MDELKKLLEQQGTAFEEFKAANDARLKAVETKGYAPADLVEKVDSINSDLNTKFREIQTELAKSRRPPSGGGGNAQESEEYKSGLLAYMRKGHDDNLRDLEKKALSGRSDPDGGYFLEPTMDAAIDRVASTVTVFASIAGTTTIGGRTYKKMVKTRGVAGGHLGVEEESPGETAAQQWSMLEIPVEGVYAEPQVPNDMLEDVDYDIEGDIIAEVGVTFGEIEGEDFISGDGVKKSRGILAYPIVANASYAWGKIGYVASGAAGDWAASNPADKLITLQHSLKQQYRAGSVMLMSDSLLSEIRQMKDGSGNYYLFNPEPTAGFAGSVLGSPVAIDDFMPAKAANSYSIAYGNFQRGYKIVRRRGIAIIRDNVTKKGYTKLFFTRRTGGGVINFEAIKLFKMAAS